tara:strand:+ start:2969 stop:3445 length:477 start_codon:yes stop_codon:yes gene_type:complete
MGNLFWSWINFQRTKANRSADAAVEEFRVFHSDPIQSALSDLDMIAVKVFAIADEPDATQRGTEIKNLWTGELHQALGVLSNGLQAIDLAENVPGHNWSASIDDARDQLNASLEILVNEAAKVSQIDAARRDAQKQLSDISHLVRTRLKSEIERRHKV